jgi:uncharacterized protein involved in exopolysaccharide biosynthesis
MKKRVTIKNSQHLADEINAPVTDINASDGEVDLFVIAGYLLKNKKLITITVFAVMFITAMIFLMRPNIYCSRASILPSGKVDKLDELKKIAGLRGSIGGDENSSVLFPVIIRSNLIQDAVLNKSYTFTRDDEKITGAFRDIFDCDNPDLLRNQLLAMTTIHEDISGNVLYITVESESPEFSQSILQNYLDELETFNLHKRQSRAKDNIKYFEQELTLGNKKLLQAEDSLETYQMANRDWDVTTDPEVIKTLSRLQRDIKIKAKMYTFLLEHYEIAKLDVQKDIPIVRILDEPSLPTISAGPKRRNAVLLSGVIALICIIFLVIAFESLKRYRQGSDRESFEILSRNLKTAFPRSTGVVSLMRGMGKKGVSLIEN